MSDSSEPVAKTKTRRRRRRMPRSAQTNYFVHLVFYEGKFRWALVLIIFTLIALVALAPKIWVASPPHVEEVVEVSGLDMMQAWTLKRSAKDLVAVGDIPGALSAWVAAIGNNPADQGAIRGFLRTLAGVPKPERGYLGTAVSQSRFLLKLALTNRLDTTLSAEVLTAYELYPQVLALVGEEVVSAEPVAVECRLIALFETGRMEEFGRIWAADQARQAARPLATLYHAAWSAGWGPVSGSAAGRAALDAAAAGNLRKRALELLLALHFSRLDLASYESVLSRLQDSGDARVNDLVRHWILLDQSGRHDRAVGLARLHSTPAETATEAELLIQAWRRLGLTEIAVDFARKEISAFPYHPGLWTALAGLLIESKNWDDLRALAIGLRESRLRETYSAWSWFLEGMVDHHENRRVDAAAQFMAAATNSFADPLLAFSSAAQMRQLGYPGPATVLLRNLQSRFPDSAVFWASLQRAAYDSRQGDVILEASEQLHQLQPTNGVVANNFAAALLTKRVRPEDALRVTDALYFRYPGNPAVRINQATALVRNHRLDDALPVLRGLAGLKMSESEETYTQMAWFEYHDSRGAKDEALAAAGKIEKRFLFADQQEWLAARVAALEGANNSAP